MSLTTLPTSSLGLPSALPTLGSIYASNYAAFQRDDSTFIFTPDIFSFSPEMKFNTSSLYIYAEQIVLSGNYYGSGFAGKTIGLYCDNLVLANNVTINVSGKNGAPGNAYASDGADKAATDGKPGQHGGSIDLFVQNGIEGVFESLELVANGGNGGQGGDMKGEKGSRAAPGGNGGNGGTITVQYGSTSHRLGLALTRAKAQDWQTSSATLRKSIAGNAEAWAAMAIDTADFITTLDTVAEQTMPLVSLRTQLESVRDNGLDNVVIDPAKALLASLQQLYKRRYPPAMDTATTASIKKLTDSATAYLDDRFDDARINTLAADLRSFRLPGGTNSAMVDVMSNAQYELRSQYQDLFDNIKRKAVAHKGRAGRNGATGSLSHGSDQIGAKAGTDGKVRVKNLAFDGRAQDVAFDSAFVLPDQIQMVMDSANDLYYTNKPENLVKAQTLYLRIVERLSIVASLNAGSGFDAALARLAKISMYSASALQRHHDWAKSMCTQLINGMDMWVHQPNWTPRLAWPYFKDEAASRLGGMKELQASFNSYVRQLDDSSNALNAITAAASQLGNSAAEAQQRMSYYGGNNGPLAAAAGRINSLTPILQQKHKKVLSLMPELITQINSQTNLDWGSLIEAIGGFAFGGWNGIAQLTNSAYKFKTQIKDGDTGGWVDKEKVVDDIQEAGNNLVSVANAWKTRENGFISTDEVQSQKLLSSKEKIDSIMKEFKSGIPKNIGQGFSDALDDYVNTAVERNNAIIEYNGVLQLWVQAVADKQYYEKFEQSLGQNKLLQDPTLPSIVNWFKARVNSEQLQIMRLLNYGASAIKFWGLTTKDQVKSLDVGPLKGYASLSNNLNQLTADFHSVLESYAQNTITDFPSPNRQGKFWRIPPDYLDQLKTLNPANDFLGTKPNHQITLPIPAPHTPAYDNDLPNNRRLFHDNYNVRVRQVRVWLPGARVDPASSVPGGDSRRPLSINILQDGAETLIATTGTAYNYIHDAVKFNFEYDTTGVNSVANCTQDKVYDTQHVTETTYNGASQNPSAETFAPIGPFSTWTVYIDLEANPGLNLTEVKYGWFEFHGWYNAG